MRPSKSLVERGTGQMQENYLCSKYFRIFVKHECMQNSKILKKIGKKSFSLKVIYLALFWIFEFETNFSVSILLQVKIKILKHHK